VYLAREALDMSALAESLGVSRATLYRWAGNRDDLLGAVLAEATEGTYRAAIARATGSGTDLLLDIFERVMRSVVASAPLRALTQREPLVFIRLAMMPGAIESVSARMTTEVIARERASGNLRVTTAPEVLGRALVRICDVHLYAPLLGGEEPEIETALELVALLLGSREPIGSTTKGVRSG
jgi:AcrR family transcriptional regulator